MPPKKWLISLMLIILVVGIAIPVGAGNSINSNNSNNVVNLNETDYTIHKFLIAEGYPSAVQWEYKKSVHMWVDYCPNCGRHNVLLINPKGVIESEITCDYCDSDFCVVSGYDKNGNFRSKLTEVEI